MSRHLAERSVDHVVLERGAVAHSWRTQRWDSLRLLTPNWMTRLPGFAYRGDDPDGYLGAAEVAALIADYAAESAAPVLTGTRVRSVRPAAGGYVVRTDRGSWHARTVVAATGAAGVAPVPAAPAAPVPARIPTTTAADYPNPTASRPAACWSWAPRPAASRSPRSCTAPAAGNAGRRRARADAADIPGQRHPLVDGQVGRARRALRRDRGPRTGPPPVLDATGRLTRSDAGPERTGGIGVRLVGRFAAASVRAAWFSGSLPNVTALADLKVAGCWNTPSTPGPSVPGSTPSRRCGSRRPWYPIPARFRHGWAPAASNRSVWASGYRPDLSYLDVDVFDHRGRVMHDGGVTASPGLYLMGLPLLRRRRSTLIDGAAGDAGDLAHAPRRPPGRTRPPPSGLRRTRAPPSRRR